MIHVGGVTIMVPDLPEVPHVHDVRILIFAEYIWSAPIPSPFSQANMDKLDTSK